MAAQDGDTVKIHYTGKLDDGTVFDTSADREPLEFTIGSGMVIPGFDNAVKDMEPGDTKEVRIPPEEAYGEHREEMTMQVERERIPDTITPEIGMMLQLRSPEGQPTNVTIIAMDDANVTLDGNHPLAGKALTFELQLVEIV